jgi:hypothetical protein
MDGEVTYGGRLAPLKVTRRPHVSLGLPHGW